MVIQVEYEYGQMKQIIRAVEGIMTIIQRDACVSYLLSMDKA
jgi:hypothetical protein